MGRAGASFISGALDGYRTVSDIKDRKAERESREADRERKDLENKREDKKYNREENARIKLDENKRLYDEELARDSVGADADREFEESRVEREKRKAEFEANNKPAQGSSFMTNDGLSPQSSDALNPVARGINADSSADMTGTKPLSFAAQGIPKPQKVFDEPEPAKRKVTLADEMAFGMRRIELARKYNQATDAQVMGLRQSYDKIKSENIHNGIAQMHRGDINGGLDALNNVGQFTGYELVDNKKSKVKINGIEQPTQIITLKRGKNEITIDTARDLNAFMTFEKQMDYGFKDREQTEKELHNRNSEANDADKANAARIKAEQESKRGGFKVEGSEVATVLGVPVVDSKGRPVVDPLSGKQMVNRDAEKEKHFYQWMAQRGITDTNEGLQKYMGENVQVPKESAPVKKPVRSLDSF